MSLFEFTFALSAVVLGLALTHVAASLHKLLLAGRRVAWAPEPMLLTTIVLLVIVSVWLFPWAEREQQSVTIGQMLLQVCKLLTLYIAAASSLPEPADAGPINLREYYDRTRALSFGALIVSLLLFSTYEFATYGFPPFSLMTLLDLLLFPALYAMLIFVRARWVNIAVLGFIVVFYGWQIVGIKLEG